MADRIYSDLQTEILGNDFDATTYQTRAQQAINDALREIARRVDLPALNGTSTITTAAGTNAYNLPTDLVRIRSLTDATTRYSLSELSDIGQFDAFLAATGIPTAYLRYGAQVLLYPTPGTARTITLRYQKDAAVLSNNTDPITAVMPDDYAHLVVEYGRARLFRMEDDPEMANYWLTEFERGLAQLKGDLQRQSNRKRRIGDGRYGSSFPTFSRP